MSYQLESFAPDSSTRKEAWKAMIPIEFVLDPDSITALQPPMPLMMMVPRCIYLPLISERIVRHFLSSLPSIPVVSQGPNNSNAAALSDSNNNSDNNNNNNTVKTHENDIIGSSNIYNSNSAINNDNNIAESSTVSGIQSLNLSVSLSNASQIRSLLESVWFRSRGQPLKWHLPLGVLFDLHHYHPPLQQSSLSPLFSLSPSESLPLSPRSGVSSQPFRDSENNYRTRSSGDCSGDDDNYLCVPWRISVCFQGFPSDQLVRFGGTEDGFETSVKARFMHCLKEATYIQYGDCSKVNNLSVLDSLDLWEGLKKNDFTRFWQANSKLMPSSQNTPPLKPPTNLPNSETVPDSTNSTPFRIPIRLFLRTSMSQKILYIQEAMSSLDARGDSKTLGQALTELLPDLFTDQDSKGISYRQQRNYLSNSEGVEKQNINTEPPLNPMISSITFQPLFYCPLNYQQQQFHNAIIWVHGICPPIETPLNWLCENLSQPDHFLYIIVLDLSLTS